MASPIGPPAYAGHEKGQADKGGITTNGAESLNDIRISMSSGETKRNTTHRQLKARHIQLIGIGGTIGTVLYVRIIYLSPQQNEQKRSHLNVHSL